MLYAVMCLSIITLWFLFYGMISILLKKNNLVQKRLSNIKRQGIKAEDLEMSQPFFYRVIKPMLDSFSKVVLKVTPKEMLTSIEKKMLLAGKSTRLTAKELISVQAGIAVGLPLVTFFIASGARLELKITLYLIFIEIALGLVVPNFALSKKISARQKKIQNMLPDTIDLLTVSVEAGLGFDGALTKVIDKMPGPLADEFESVLQEIKVGKQKRDALRDMSDRIGVPDLSTFISSIIQADQFGVSIGNVLRIQSEQMRQKRRQRAQEKAMKAPVKMVIPMVLFIFPTIFSVLLGPIVIQIMNTFNK